MKLLLDENLPVKLKYRFQEHGIETFTVADKKWHSKQNGELLSLMIAESFTHLITFDSNISFQQNFVKYPVPVVMIVAASNNYEMIMEIFNEIVSCIGSAKVGSNVVIHPGKVQ